MTIKDKADTTAMLTRLIRDNACSEDRNYDGMVILSRVSAHVNSAYEIRYYSDSDHVMEQFYAS